MRDDDNQAPDDETDDLDDGEAGDDDAKRAGSARPAADAPLEGADDGESADDGADDGEGEVVEGPAKSQGAPRSDASAKDATTSKGADEEVPSLAQFAHDSWTTIRLVAGTHRGYSAGLWSLGAVAAVLSPAIAWTGRAIVDAVERAADAHDPSLRVLALQLVALELALVIASAVAERGAQLFGSLLQMLVGQRVNERVLEKTLTLDLADFEDSKVIDHMTRARREASHRPFAHVSQLIEGAFTVVSLLGLGALLSMLSWWAVLGLVIATAPTFAAQLWFQKAGFRLDSWRTPETRLQNYLEMLLARGDYAKEVKLYGLGPRFLARYRAIFHSLWAEDRDLAVRRAGYVLGLTELSTLVFYGVYASLAWAAAGGELTLGAMTMGLLAFRQAQSLLQSTLGVVTALSGDRLYLRSLLSFLEHRSVSEREGWPRGTATSGPTPDDGIRFEQVSFAYPGAASPVIDGVSLHLPPRHKLALVGENGAGKTTIIKLLTRLYRPTSGRILLDGLPLDAWDERALHQRIGVIFQDFVQYQLTVGENIGAGDERAYDDEARWSEAAEQGMATDVIKKLPSGFATQLGKWFENGRDLSLGQWQKIALSRAFMRKDADILVLDEPTASMDAEAEARIFARFRALTETRTAILISHRFSTVRMADTIAVLEGGRIVEHGTHESLVRLGGRYAHLFTLQAQGYR